MVVGIHILKQRGEQPKNSAKNLIPRENPKQIAENNSLKSAKTNVTYNQMSKLMYYFALLIVFATFSINGAEVKKFIPSTSIPNVDFEVATRQQTGNAINKGIHIFRLYCGLGECRLDQFSLNECEPVGAVNSSFTLKTQGWATWAGNLELKVVSGNTLEVRVFQATHHGFPAHLSFSYFPELPISKRVKAFVAKDFLNLKLYPELITVEYVPIVGSFHVEPIDCPIMVQGIEK